MTTKSTRTTSRVAGKKTRRPRSKSTVPKDHDPDDFELELEDIPDFPLRSKVAQLMAVAPAFSVSQLYHLLVDKEGHFETAKEYIMPRSPASQTASYPTTSIKPQAILSQPSDSDPTQDPYDDQVMVKIDWDNSDLLFDNDAPSFLFPEAKKSKKKPAEKTPQSKAVSKPNNRQRNNLSQRSVLRPKNRLLTKLPQKIHPPRTVPPPTPTKQLHLSPHHPALLPSQQKTLPRSKPVRHMPAQTGV
jgi:hypothetical protein